MFANPYSPNSPSLLPNSFLIVAFCDRLTLWLRKKYHHQLFVGLVHFVVSESEYDGGEYCGKQTGAECDP